MFGEKAIGIALLVGVFILGGGLAWIFRGLRKDATKQ